MISSLYIPTEYHNDQCPEAIHLLKKDIGYIAISDSAHTLSDGLYSNITRYSTQRLKESIPNLVWIEIDA